MEYSPMLIIVLWALTPSDCLSLDSTNSTEEVAKVKEMQGPSMTIRNEEEFIPGYFTFNDGQPFLVEKDPLTGNLNLNIKTTPVKTPQHILKNTNDYFYDDDEETDYSKETIDRKDGDIYGVKTFGQNDIKSITKEHDDLHKFLNLPVRYSSEGKFPLISSSYANTKVQGHGSSSYSNHKIPSTDSPSVTVSPTYNTQHSSTRPITSATTSSIPTYRTTNTIRTTTSTTTSAYDYEYIDYYDDKYDTESSEKPAINSIPFGLYTPSSYLTSTVITTTTTKPPTTTSVRLTSISSETTTPITSKTSTEKVAIVTSLPIDTKEEEFDIDKTPLSIKLSTTTTRTEYNNSNPKNITIKESFANANLENSDSNIVINISENPVGIQQELEFGMRLTTAEPHRGSIGNKSNMEPVGFGYGVPVSNGIVTGLRPPPWGYSGIPPFQPMGSVHPHPLPPKRPHPPSEYKPNYEGNYMKPGAGNPTPPHTYLTVGSNHPPYPYRPVLNKPLPSFFPEDQTQASSINQQSFNNSMKHKHTDSYINDNFNIVVGNMPKYPPQKLNISNIPKPNINLNTPNHSVEHNIKPSYHDKLPPNPSFELSQGHRENQVGSKKPLTGFSEQIPTEGFSLVPDNQFILAPQEQGNPSNPSYSLQTSFSIGAPTYEEDKEVSRPIQGIGQVLFPDDDKVDINKRPTLSPRPPGQPQIPSATHHQNGPPHPSHHPTKLPQIPHIPNSVMQGPHHQGGNPHPSHSGPLNPHSVPSGPLNHHSVPSGPLNPHSVPSGPLNPHSVPSGSQNPHLPYVGAQGPHHGNSHLPNNGRPPVPLQSRPPPRFPPPDVHPSGSETYPRPWDDHHKHPYIYNPSQKKDPLNQGQSFLPPKRPKPQSNSQRPDLPNILPQFRPNAKVGPGEYHGSPHPSHPSFVGPSKVREPYDTLQPPPLPRPQFLRHQGHEDNISEKKKENKEHLPIHLPLVHKRMSGPQSGSRVTPLGSNLPPRNAMLRTDFKEYEKKKDEPVFVVYPSNGANKMSGHSDGMVVVGTRGPQRPLSPDNLGIQEDPDSFHLEDNNDNFPLPGRDRIDTPILKSKSTPKPHLKLEFPYNLVKPGSVEPPQKIINAGMVDIKKEYTAYSPTVSASTEEMLLKDHDSEINIIPYLQDYMPYATKKPVSKPIEGWNLENKSTLKPLSVTLNTLLGSTNNQIKNHLMVTERNDSEPERQDFQAPFHASLSEPSQGWSVVTQNSAAPDKVSTERTTSKPTERTKFDIDNFKPELLSGFKPIIPPKFDDDRPTTKSP